MREVCSSVEGGDGDLPKVTKLGRGQLSWDSNPGGGGEGERPGGGPGELEGAFLPLLAVSLAKSHKGRSRGIMQRELTSWDTSGVTSRHYLACSVILTTL